MMIWGVDIEIWRGTANVLLSESLVNGANGTVITVYDDDDHNDLDADDMFASWSGRRMADCVLIWG